MLGWSFMPWQQQVSDVANEIDPATGHRFYRTVVLSVMRQQGKTTLTLPTWVERCASWPGVSVAWTMQTGTDAREKWLEEHVPALLDSPLASQIRVRKQNGSEHVKFSNGSIQRLMASGKSSGHGKVVDLGMIDEAMAQPDDRLHQALRPAMKTRYRDLAMPDGSVQCCVTSPPYWGLRDYGQDGQLGLESTPDEFVANLVAVFAEVRRVLADDGTPWWNLGDSYAADRGGSPPPA